MLRQKLQFFLENFTFLCITFSSLHSYYITDSSYLNWVVVIFVITRALLFVWVYLVKFTHLHVTAANDEESMKSVGNHILILQRHYVYNITQLLPIHAGVVIYAAYVLEKINQELTMSVVFLLLYGVQLKVLRDLCIYKVEK